MRYGVEPTQDFYSCFVPLQTAAEGAEHLVGTEPAVPEARAVPRWDGWLELNFSFRLNHSESCTLYVKKLSFTHTCTVKICTTARELWVQFTTERALASSLVPPKISSIAATDAHSAKSQQQHLKLSALYRLPVIGKCYRNLPVPSGILKRYLK